MSPDFATGPRRMMKFRVTFKFQVDTKVKSVSDLWEYLKARAFRPVISGNHYVHMLSESDE